MDNPNTTIPVLQNSTEVPNPIPPQNIHPILDARPDLNIYWNPKSSKTLEERAYKSDKLGTCSIHNCFRLLGLNFTFNLLDILSGFRGSEVSLSGLERGHIESFLELPFLYPSSKYQQSFRAKSIIDIAGERLGVITYDLPKNIKPRLTRDKLVSCLNAGKISLIIFPNLYDPERKNEGWRRLLENLSSSSLSKDFTGPFSPNY